MLIFSSLFALLITSYSFILVKFFPVLVHHTAYYCREMAKVITLNLPEYFGNITIGVLVITAIFSSFKLFVIVYKVSKFRKSLSRSISINPTFPAIAKTLNLSDKIVVLREDKPAAFCFGTRKPKIYITTGLIKIINKKELKIVLLHEKYHLEHNDNLVLLLATIAESLFPFFPVLSDIIRIYKTDRELLADQAAIQGGSDKRNLSSILKKLLQYEPLTRPAFAPAIADGDTLETRIKSLFSVKVDYRRLGKRNLFLSFVFVIVLIGLIRSPVIAVEIHRDGLDSMVVCGENVSCENICK